MYPTLDRLQILQSVAETGSFSAARCKLNRAQSVISYAKGRLIELDLEPYGELRGPYFAMHRDYPHCGRRLRG